MVVFTQPIHVILGRTDVLRTIKLGTAILVQGIFVRELTDGRIEIKVNNTKYSGKPVTQTA